MWDDSGTPDDAFVTRPAQVTVKDLVFQEPVRADLVTDRVYAWPADRLVKAGAFPLFKDVPFYDAPVLIAEKALILR